MVDREIDDASAVSLGNGPVVVFAGPGTGKTHLLSKRVRFLVDELNISADSIVVVTFTNFAARELTQRIRSELAHRPDADSLVSRAQIGTIHAFCGSLIRQYQHINILPRRAYLSAHPTDQLLFLARHQARLGLGALFVAWTGEAEARGAPKWRRTYRDFLGEAAQTFNYISEQVLGDSDEQRSAYDRICRGEGEGCDHQLIRTYDKYRALLSDLHLCDYSALLSSAERLLDEPEVLSRIRKSIRFILVDEYQDTNPIQDRILRKCVGDAGNIFVVGDDDQAIYGFRGADVRSLTDFSRKVSGCSTVHLATNRRATEQLVETASRLISHNRARVEKKLVALRGGGAPAILVRRDEGHARAAWVAAKIAELKHSGVVARYSQYAILFRSVRASSAEYVEALNQAGIPHALGGKYDPLDIKEVRDLLEKMRAAATKTIEPAASIFDIFQSAVGGNDGLERWPEVSRRPLASVGRIIAELGSGAEHLDMPAQIELLIRHLAVTRIDREVSEEADVVQLSTVHEAKGLEFEVVFVADLLEGRFPMLLPSSARERMDRLFAVRGDSFEERLEEERRCFYVAITRARSLLFLLSGESSPSRYVEEIKALADSRLIGADEIVDSTTRLDHLKKSMAEQLDSSAISDFELCPYKFYLRHHCGFPGDQNQVDEQLAGVTRALEILHRFLIDGIRPSDEMLDRFFDLAWPKAQPESFRPREQWRLRYKTYARRRASDTESRIAAIDRPFTLSVAGWSLIGRIPLLIQRGDALEISRLSPRPIYRVDAAIQRELSIARCAEPDTEARALIHDLVEDETHRVELSAADATFERLARTVELIRSKQFVPNPSVDRCSSCSMRKICEHSHAKP